MNGGNNDNNKRRPSSTAVDDQELAFLARQRTGNSFSKTKSSENKKVVRPMTRLDSWEN